MRREETLAFELVARVLGIAVESHDDGSEPGMVDALIQYGDGEVGALEVTTLADQATMQLEGELGDGTYTVAGASLAWHVRIPTGVSLREFRKRLDQVVHECESAGHTNVEGLRWSGSDDARWFVESRIDLQGFPTSAHPGAVHAIARGGGGGAIDHELTKLVPWLHDEFENEPFAGHIAKLERTGLRERHLFAHVHDSTPLLPEDLMLSMTFNETLPVAPLDPPGGLTCLWLVPKFTSSALVWHAYKGWLRVTL